MAKLTDIAVLAITYSEGNEGYNFYVETVETFLVDDLLLSNIKDFLSSYFLSSYFKNRITPIKNNFLNGIDEWFTGVERDDTSFYLGGYYDIQLFTKKLLIHSDSIN